MGGYMGKIACVDLSTGAVKVEELLEQVQRAYIGGATLAAHIMGRFRFAEIDPLGPENVLIFAVGPLTGANVPTSGRYAVAAKSPATGIWGEADSGGRFGIAAGTPPLQFGNGETVLSLIRQIAEGDGIGAMLRHGVSYAARQLGPDAEKFALHVKLLEPPYHDPRAIASLAVAYATANRGACHRGCTHTLERSPMPGLGYDKPLDRLSHEGKGKAAAIAQNYAELSNSLKFCSISMSALDMPILVTWTRCVTGWDIDAAELLKAGERSFNLKRMLNVSCGITRRDDTLPYRFTHEPFQSGASAGHLPDLPKMLDEYYEFRGWDNNGVPTKAKLAELGLA